MVSKLNEKSKEIKPINVSEKRQITIPKRFYDQLNMGQEIICELRGDEIILRNIPKEEDFSEEILKDLVKQGYEGESLVKAFQSQKAQIRPAVEQLLADGKHAAKNLDGNGEQETEELFGDLKD